MASISSAPRERKGGRPSKGQRDSGILAKPQVNFGAIIRENADRLGYSYGDYLVLLAAQQLGMPQYAPVPTRDVNQSTLSNFPEVKRSTAA